MNRAALFVIASAYSLAAHAMPADCEEIRSFDPAQHPRNYPLLDAMRERCAAALRDSPDALARKAISSIQLSQELDKAHQARLSARLDVLQRTRAIVEPFRQAGASAFASIQGSDFGEALQALDVVQASANQMRNRTFANHLPGSFDKILLIPAGASEETIALIHVVGNRVAAAAARSDEQIAALDSLLLETIDTSRASINRLRTGAALVADRTTLQELADSASAELLDVQAELAFARFTTKVKARTVLLQATAAANAGARNSALSRVSYLDHAYLAFSSALPQRLRAPLAEGAAAKFLGQIETVRESMRTLSDADAQARMQSYVLVRAQQFHAYSPACLASAGSNAPALEKLGRDLSALPQALPQLTDEGMRVFVLESIVDRLDISRALCESAA